MCQWDETSSTWITFMFHCSDHLGPCENICHRSHWSAGLKCLYLCRRCCLWKHVHVAFRNKQRKHSCGCPPLRQPPLHHGGRSTRLPERSKPCAASSPHAVRSVDSLVTCSSLRRRLWQKQSASLRAPLFVCRCCRRLFVFRDFVFLSCISKLLRRRWGHMPLSRTVFSSWAAEASRPQGSLCC